MKKVSLCVVVFVAILMLAPSAFSKGKVENVNTNVTSSSSTFGVKNVEELQKAQATEEILENTENFADKKDATVYPDSPENTNTGENP